MEIKLHSKSFEEIEREIMRPCGIEEVFSLDKLGGYVVNNDCFHPKLKRSVLVLGIFAHYESDCTWLVVQDNATGQILEVYNEY